MKWYNKTDFPVVARTSPGMCRRPRAQALQFGPIRDYNAAGTVRMGQMNGSLFVRRTSPWTEALHDTAPVNPAGPGNVLYGAALCWTERLLRRGEHQLHRASVAYSRAGYVFFRGPELAGCARRAGRGCAHVAGHGRWDGLGDGSVGLLS
jgi:hypothetical protein